MKQIQDIITLRDRVEALEKEIAELKGQVSERQISVSIDIPELTEKVVQEIVKGLRSSSSFHSL